MATRRASRSCVGDGLRGGDALVRRAGVVAGDGVGTSSLSPYEAIGIKETVTLVIQETGFDKIEDGESHRTRATQEY